MTSDRPGCIPPQVLQGRSRFVERPSARSYELVVPACSAAARRRAGGQTGGDQSPGFKAVKGCVDGARCDIPFQAYSNVFQNGPAISVAAESYQSHKDCLFKASENFSHNVYIVDNNRNLSRPFLISIVTTLSAGRLLDPSARHTRLRSEDRPGTRGQSFLRTYKSLCPG